MGENRAIVVTAAILVADGKVLICQRHHTDAYGMQWEFPGGKVEEKEDLRSSLMRELGEELSIQAEVGEEVFRLHHRYPDRFVEVVFFRVAAYQGIIRNHVFEAIEWVDRHRLTEYPFLEADRELVRLIAKGEVI